MEVKSHKTAKAAQNKNEVNPNLSDKAVVDYQLVREAVDHGNQRINNCNPYIEYRYKRN